MVEVLSMDFVVSFETPAFASKCCQTLQRRLYVTWKTSPNGTFKKIFSKETHRSISRRRQFSPESKRHSLWFWKLMKINAYKLSGYRFSLIMKFVIYFQ